MTKNYNKRIPVEGAFMSNKLNDNVYGALLIESFGNGEGSESRTLVSKMRIDESASWIKVYPDLDNTKARRKWNGEIRKYIKAGLIKEVKYKSVNYSDEIPCYELSKEFKELYYIIPSRTLEYLINTKSQHSIRIYCYLMFKYNGNKKYTFTQKEIISNVFNQKSITNEGLNKKVNDILFDLEQSGFFKINHDKYISLNSKATRVKQFINLNLTPIELQNYFNK